MHLYIFLSLDNLLQVNMSIAILPMATEFNWNPATVGLIQSSFFWGYLLTQVFPKLCSFKVQCSWCTSMIDVFLLGVR